MNEASRNETDALRSEIDVTRRRMDETMDALGDRLHGRHLVDEILGFFRRRDSDGHAATDKFKQSATAAMHSVVDTVKANPLPTLAIGAGVAWLIYEARKKKSPVDEPEFDTEYDYNQEFMLTEDVTYDPDLHYDRPLEYSTGDGKFQGLKHKAAEKLRHAKDAISEKTSAAKEKLGHVGEQARDKVQAMRERAGELGTRAKERTREAYARSRERVVSTADQHPLEVGLGCLALGLIVGLLLPTPEKVNQVAGERMDRLRDRTREAGREVLQKGRRVAQAASQAAQDEAQTQGLTLDALREKVGEAGSDPARRDNSGASNQRDEGNLSGSSSGNPSAARPVT